MAQQLREFQRIGFDCQHPHGGSKLSVTPVPGDLMSSSVLRGHQAHINAGKTLVHINYNNKMIFKIYMEMMDLENKN